MYVVGSLSVWLISLPWWFSLIFFFFLLFFFYLALFCFYIFLWDFVFVCVFVLFDSFIIIIIICFWRDDLGPYIELNSNFQARKMSSILPVSACFCYCILRLLRQRGFGFFRLC